MTKTLEHPVADPLDEAGQALLFTAARTASTWADTPVTDEELRVTGGRFNAALQAGYFILAVRALGLAAGPRDEFALHSWRPRLLRLA